MYLRGNVYYSRIAGPDGQMVRQRLSTDKKVASVMLGELRKRVELQRFGVLPKKVEGEVKDCATIKHLYIDRLRTHGRSSGTIEMFALCWRLVIEDQKCVWVNQITQSKIEAFCKDARERGLKGQTINYYVGMAKDALDWARDFEYISKSPLARWEPVAKDAPRKRRDMTPEEIERFFATEDDPEFRLRWKIYFRTGLRATAGASVEWEWILWNERAMLLPTHANKSRRDHWLPLDDTLLEELKERRRGLPEGAATGPIFPPMSAWSIRRRFRAICKRAGIDLDGLCLHSIRHTYATGSFEASGHNVKVVQKLLGHADAATTMIYIHTSEEEMRRVNDEVAARYGMI
jgi:integrase